ncbi:MAG TPA: sulfatase [Kofleriaceae bacterium]|jgi:arylsulfatase A-like enzyme
MSYPHARASGAWIVVAHAAAGAALGAIEAGRLHGLAGTLIPLFAVTGLAAGAVIAAAERLAGRAARHGGRWAKAAPAIAAAPVLVIAIPVAATLFQGAFASTLPGARAVPILLPLVAWGGVTIAIALGRRLGDDQMVRAMLVLGLTGALGAIVWTEKHVLGAGYQDAHVGATLAVIVLAGTAVRVVVHPRVPRALAAAIAGITVVGAGLACALGLRDADDRQRLAAVGDEGKDLVRVWRGILDFDRDGASALLGGGDCDDFDGDRYPGARDTPGDGIDQDCDGVDAQPVKPVPAAKPLDLAAWRASAPVQQLLARTKDMTIVLITVDALREDMLAPGAPHRDDFPRLARLLDDSVWFTRAIAPGSSTDTSLSTLLTGRFDPYQRVATTLPEALHATGRRTYAALPDEVTRYVGDTLPARGVDKAVPVYTDWEQADIGDHISAPATAAEGLKALDDAAGKPAFIWLHFFDVHEHHQIKVPPSVIEQVHDVGDGDVHLVYRALLHQIDSEVGRVLDALAAKGLADKTIIIFASDHGEALGDDPRYGDTHGRVTYGPLVRIPIAIHIPGVTPGQRTDAVSLVDLAPTLLDLVGAPTAIQPLDGLDLLPALLDAPAVLRPSGRAIVLHEEWQWAVVEWPYHLLVKPADNVTELYDLSSDKYEKTDIAAQHPEIVSRLRARYAEQPEVKIDRTVAGRAWRESQAQPLPRPAPP